MIKKKTLKRLEEAKEKASQKTTKELEKLLSKMTVEELRELAYSDFTEERYQEIVKRAKAR